MQELKCLKYLNNLLHTHKALTHMGTHTHAHTNTHIIFVHGISLILVNTTIYVWVTPDFRTDETWVGNTLLHYLGQPKFTLSCAQNIQRYQTFIATSTKSATIHITTWLLKHELTLKLERCFIKKINLYWIFKIILIEWLYHISNHRDLKFLIFLFRNGLL